MKIEKTLIDDIMDRNPLVLQPHCTVAEALQQLTQRKLESAPVVDQHLELVGFFSTHDLLVHLWNNDYQQQPTLTVAELMREQVETVNSSDSVLQLAEQICIDHDQLYPVTSSGMLTSMRAGSIEERARSMKVAKPKQYPVIKDKKLIGMVSRAMVTTALQAQLYSTTAESRESAA